MEGTVGSAAAERPSRWATSAPVDVNAGETLQLVCLDCLFVALALLEGVCRDQVLALHFTQRPQELGDLNVVVLNGCAQYASSGTPSELEPDRDGRIDAGDDACVEDLCLILQDVDVGLDVSILSLIIENTGDHLHAINLGSHRTQ